MLRHNFSRRKSYSLPARYFRATLAVWLFIIVIVTCNSNDPVTGTEPIAGLYVATTFTEPGQLNGGVGILANGGILTARLGSNYEVEGRLLIPDNIGSNFAPTDMSFSGEFNLNGNTLRFLNTQTFLDRDLYQFLVSDTRLENLFLDPRSAITIILDKQQ